MVEEVGVVVVVEQDGQLVRVVVSDEAVLVHVPQEAVTEVYVLLREHFFPLYQCPKSEIGKDLRG